MSFRMVPKSVTLYDLEGVMALTLRNFAEFGKPAFQHITASARIELRPVDPIYRKHLRRRASICAGIYAPVYCIL